MRDAGKFFKTLFFAAVAVASLFFTFAREARAADACSWAVDGEMGDDARVDSITKTEPNNGGWYVTGTASRLGGEVRSFGCSYRSGRVVDVSFG